MTIDTISTDRLAACPCCGRSMRFERTVPKVGDLPEMETFECTLCRLAVTAEQVLQFPELLSSAPAQSCQEKRSPDSLPWKCRGRSLRPWPYGGRCLNGLAVSDAFAYHRVSIFRDVLARHKRAASKTAKPSALRGRQRLCLRPVPLQVEPAEQVVPIISLPGRSVRPKKHIPVGPQLKQPSGLGFRTNCNNVADLVMAHGERRWRLQAVMECHSRHPHYGGGSDQH
jgi:hypothetical protein